MNSKSFVQDILKAFIIAFLVLFPHFVPLWRYKGNLWYPIISHAIYDTVALTMIYFGIVI